MVDNTIKGCLNKISMLAFHQERFKISHEQLPSQKSHAELTPMVLNSAETGD